eukprot:SAG11_NODE_35358_length_267_cov_0.589286_1_plen_27_part_01
MYTSAHSKLVQEEVSRQLLAAGGRAPQ